MYKNMPHGGTLINRIDLKAVQNFSLNFVELVQLELSDLELIANGAYSPLDGFMGKADYESVLADMRFANGIPCSLPITLAVTEKKAAELSIGEQIHLVHNGGLYRKARNGEILEFTGISSPYELPVHPEIVIETHKLTIEQSVKKVLTYLSEKKIL
ncbi:adenylyl-sulfate kinase [Neobacillus fumarioli]|uniref:adenylyl-sulfate kinase n=1 Tax=Neobacillus fumarioli TaxID=105229 RepID=UPI000833FCE7|nr:adenylyl-sulfate kinase [Neobacillus fumarioli]